jgi:hypothetical protein
MNGSPLIAYRGFVKTILDKKKKTNMQTYERRDFAIACLFCGYDSFHFSMSILSSPSLKVTLIFMLFIVLNGNMLSSAKPLGR